MRVASLVLLSLLFPTMESFGAEKQHNWEQATVISQKLGTQLAGTRNVPAGGGSVAMPYYKTANIVVVETGHYRYKWSEVGGRLGIVPVNGTIQFYRDGDFFIVLDIKNKKHKFTLVGETLLK